MVDPELLDRVRRFDRVSTLFHFGLSARLPWIPLPISPSTERETATLADLLLISLPPPFFSCFPSCHAKPPCIDGFISARETRGIPEPGPLRWGALPALLITPFLVLIAPPIAPPDLVSELTGFPALIGSERRSCSRWHFIGR
jgi:hypothetical protein